MALCLCSSDLALEPSWSLTQRFFGALGRQLFTFESWTMFHLEAKERLRSET